MNIRPATKDDADFIGTMLYEAARWNPDWPRESIEEFLDEPSLRRYHEDWGREGDGGVIAEIDGEPVGAAWYRVFTEEMPGLGFVNEKTPLLRSCIVQAREEGFQALSLSVAVHNRSRMMYQRAGFEKIAESGESWTMLSNL